MFFVIVLVAVIAACGYVFATSVVRTKSPYAVFGLTFTFGPAVWLLLANGLAYAVSLRTAFALSLLLIAIFDLVQLRSFRALRLEKNDRAAVWFLFGLTIAIGFVHARFIGSDPWSWQHFPLASTIVAGNFPVMTPIDPLHHLYYHYAPAFTAAGFQLLTGLPLTAGFAFQPLVGAAGILFFVAALVRELTGSVRTAVVASLLAIGGAGLQWINGPELFALVQMVLSGFRDTHALNGLGTLVASPITVSPLMFLGHRSTAMGLPLLFGLFWTLRAWTENNSRSALVGGFVFALALTLTMELAFVTICCTLAVTAGIALLTQSSRPFGIKVMWFGLAALVPALLIGLVHGGVLTGLLAGGTRSFIPHISSRLMYNSYGSTVAFYSLQFLRDFGLPLLLLPLAAVFAWRRRHTQPVWLVLLGLGVLHFLLPFLVEYQLIRGEMRRSFYPATSIFALMSGVYVCDRFLASRRRSLRATGVGLIAAMLISSSIYLVLRGFLPQMRWQPEPLFAQMPAATSEQMATYEWVKKNTSLSDFFYVRNLTVPFEALVSEEDAQLKERILFMTYTGRYTIGPIIFWDYTQEWLDDNIRAERTCDTATMKRLHVQYLLVENAERAAWFASKCRASDWNVRYQRGAAAPFIYELIPQARK